MAKERVKLNAFTKRLFQRNGYLCEVVEHFNAYAGKTNDLFGFADLIATSPSEKKTVLIQTTTSSNLSARRNKIQSMIEAVLCLDSGLEIVIVHWSAKTELYTDARGTLRSHTLYVPRLEFVLKESCSEELQSTALPRFKLITQLVDKDILEEQDTRFEKARYPLFANFSKPQSTNQTEEILCLGEH